MIGKTNVSAYSAKSAGNGDMSISCTRIPITFTGAINNIVQHEKIVVVQPKANTCIYVSEDDGNGFQNIPLGFYIRDIIYSELYHQFIAVGYKKGTTVSDSKMYLATSADAVQWEIRKVETETMTTGALVGIAERNGVLHVLRIYAQSKSNLYCSACRIEFVGNEITLSEIENKLIWLTENDSLSYLLAMETIKTDFATIIQHDKLLFFTLDYVSLECKDSGVTDVAYSFSGSFLTQLRKTAGKIALSYNGKDFTTASESGGADISFILKDNNTYYGFLGGAVCCGKTIKEMVANINNPITISGLDVPIAVNYVTVVNGQIYMAGDGLLYKMFINSDYQPEMLMLSLDAAKAAYERTLALKKQVEGMIGTTDISMIGDGTLTGAVKAIYDSLNEGPFILYE